MPRAGAVPQPGL